MKTNRAIIFLVISFIVLITAISASIFLKEPQPPPPPIEEEKVLNILNWEGYLSETIIKDFETKFNVKVNLYTFEDSSEMFGLFQSRPDKYDLVVLEDDYLQIMKKIKLLLPLNHQKIPNLKNLKEVARNNTYDKGNEYCVPYVMGYTGIVINEEYIKDFDGTRKILWEPKYKGKISMPNNAIEILLNSLFALGYDLNDLTTIEQLNEAKNFALSQKDLVLGYDNPLTQRELLIKEKAWVAYIYSTEVFDIIQKNPRLKFFAPKEGVLLWADNWCISKDSPHKNLAHQFLNYLLETEVAAKNSQEIGALMAVDGIDKFLNPVFLEKTKSTDFPEDREILQKSGYRTTDLLNDEVQFIANELLLELEIED